jgi:hypothetical protein
MDEVRGGYEVKVNDYASEIWNSVGALPGGRITLSVLHGTLIVAGDRHMATRHDDMSASRAPADVIEPAAFNERFTIYLNAAGEPVERTLREMTAGEVLAAIRWHDAEADRLRREAEPYNAIAIAFETGRTDEIPDLSRDELRAGGAALRRAGEANMKTARLMKMVQVNMPQWRDGKMQLGDALLRYWPGGRARGRLRKPA